MTAQRASARPQIGPRPAFSIPAGSNICFQRACSARARDRAAGPTRRPASSARASARSTATLPTQTLDAKPLDDGHLASARQPSTRSNPAPSADPARQHRPARRSSAPRSRASSTSASFAGSQPNLITAPVPLHGDRTCSSHDREFSFAVARSTDGLDSSAAPIDLRVTAAGLDAKRTQQSIPCAAVAAHGRRTPSARAATRTPASRPAPATSRIVIGRRRAWPTPAASAAA